MGGGGGQGSCLSTGFPRLRQIAMERLVSWLSPAPNLTSIPTATTKHSPRTARIIKHAWLRPQKAGKRATRMVLVEATS